MPEQAVEQSHLDIVKYDGMLCRLSETLYEIQADPTGEWPSKAVGDLGPDFKPGSLVRMICEHHEGEPGKHFKAEWATVCPFSAMVAQFVGVPRRLLKPADPAIAAHVETMEKTVVLPRRLKVQPPVRPAAWRSPGPLAIMSRTGAARVRAADGREILFDDNNRPYYG